MIQRRFRIRAGVGAALAFLAAYAFVYIVMPFPEPWSDLISVGMTPLAALAAACVAALVWRRYGKSTLPRGIWRDLMLALLGWAVAEAIWFWAYYLGGEELAAFGLADLFWVISYGLFASALLRQYISIYRPRREIWIAYLALSAASVLTFAFLFSMWLANANRVAFTLQTLVNSFYPIGDIALSIGALVLAYSFRDGALGRPWLGLLAFTFSDLLYTLLNASGTYAWSLVEGNFLTAVTDISYLAAYLVMALGCYLQLILLSYGPRLTYDKPNQP